MYDPPEPEVVHWGFSPYEEYDTIFAYDEGYAAAHLLKYLPFLLGAKCHICPYKPSGHERDTTWADEAHYLWNRGFDDYE